MVYRINQINNYTWLIGEDIRSDFTATMVLVAGKKKAALIDTGCGVGNLRKLVSAYTDLPIIVLTTHVHADHIGAHSLFDQIYASDLEMQMWIQSGQPKTFLEDRLRFLHTAVEGDEERFREFEKNIVRDCQFSWESLKDGMVFDLGDVVLEACMVPGHTKESFVFVERESGNAFVGDSINPTPWIFPEGGTGVLDYGKSVERFRNKFPKVRHLYSGHCMGDIGIQTIEDTIECVKEIQEGSKDPEVECYAGKVFQHVRNSVTMFYTERFESKKVMEQ